MTDTTPSHLLTVKRLDRETAGKARQTLIDRGHDIHEGSCSCGQWKVAIAMKPDIESLHQEHREAAEDRGV